MRNGMTRGILSITGCIGATILVFTPSAFAGDYLNSETAAATTQTKGACSNETFKGDYEVVVNGSILPSPGVSLPIQGVQILHSDGKGHLLDTESLVVNGAPLAGPDGKPLGQPPAFFSLHTGTYTINADCTGFANETNGFNFVNLAVVIDRAGKRITMVVVPPYDTNGTPRVITGIGQRFAEPAESNAPQTSN
jgi:hypothetical protein